MRTRSAIAFLAAVLAVVSLFAVSANAQYPGKGQVPIAPTSIPQFVDPLPHFAGARVDATKPNTPLTVEAMALDQQALSTGTVLGNGTVVGAGAGLTHVWGYRISNGNVTAGPLWPGFTVEAMRGVPVDMLILNKLTESYDAVNLPVDQTLHWADPVPPADPFALYTGPVPTVVHLHGGEVPDWADGGPDAWYTPNGGIAGHSALTNLMHYPNTQEAATLWFHDHALGATRLNVYAGLAAFYFLRDNGENALHLPGWSGDGKVQEFNAATGTFGAPYLPEIEVVIQDRMFDTNGQLYFPATPPDVPNPTIHPYWTPEFIGDVITVNGKTWPYLSVAPRKYRIRLLDGSNARFYELWLQADAAAGGNRGRGRGQGGAVTPRIYQIGTDGGLLDVPVAITGKLVIAPGERQDLIIDFTGTTGSFTLRNSAPTPYPGGGAVVAGTTDRIMQFRVDGQMAGADASVITGRAVPMQKLANFATARSAVTVNKQRQLTLNEHMGMGGPVEALVNNTKWGGMIMDPALPQRPYNDYTMDPSGTSNTMYSEIMQEGETEVWQIINLTADAHPIHLHLVQFQLLSRQNFNVTKYNRKYDAAFAAAGVGLAAFTPGWGPPLNYNTGADAAGTVWTPYLGGNPDVTPHLQGKATMANVNEQGWKDTFIMYPGQVTTVIARWAPTDASVTSQSNTLWFGFDPSGGGTGHGYVWHCHIIDHEDNEMMRPYLVVANPNAPGSRTTAPLYAGYLNTHPSASLAAAAAFAGNGESDAPVTNGLPKAFALDQNTPNPFNPTTQIRFALPAESHVSLTIYNVAGERVATLIDDTAPAGFHTVQLDAANLASGVYFYRLNAGNFSQTKKMVLLK